MSLREDLDTYQIAHELGGLWGAESGFSGRDIVSELRLRCTPGFKVQEIALEGCGFCGTRIMPGIKVTTGEKKVEPLGMPL